MDFAIFFYVWLFFCSVQPEFCTNGVSPQWLFLYRIILYFLKLAEQTMIEHKIIKASFISQLWILLTVAFTSLKNEADALKRISELVNHGFLDEIDLYAI